MMFDRGFMALPTCVALVAVLVVCLAQRVGMRRTCLYLVLTVYVGAVAAVTLFPLPVGLQLGSPQDQVVVWGATINLRAFRRYRSNGGRCSADRLVVDDRSNHRGR